METVYSDFIISDDKEKLQIPKIKEMLTACYWGKNRTSDIIQKSIENSICFGVYRNEQQVGFARCVTDYSTIYWLCDVVIDDYYRGLGLGKALMKAITGYDVIKSLRGVLATKDAHGLYEQFGFVTTDGRFMLKEQP